MTFKTKKIERGFHKLDYRVKVILVALDVARAMENWPELVVTSTIRADGVHAVGRAADVGVNGLTIKQRREEWEWVNQRFPRRGRYKTAVLHRNKNPKTRKPQRGQHFHLQVSGLNDTEYFENHKTILEKP